MSVATLIRPWRSLRPRTRAVVAFLMVAAAIGGWYALWSLYDPWPARAILRTPGDTWPLTFSPDGRDFLTSGQRGITRWDVATGAKEGEAWAIPDGESAFVGAFAPDGRTYAAVCASRQTTITIRLFDRASGRILWSQPIPFRSAWALNFVDEGRALRGFVGNIPNPKEGMTTITWDAATGEELTKRPLLAPIQNCIAPISANGRTMALGPMSKLVAEVWDLDTDTSLGSFRNPNTTSVICWGGVGLSADGKTLALGREDGSVEVWDVATRTLKATHSIHLRASGLRFSPDGKTLAANAELLRATSTVEQFHQLVRQLLNMKGRDYSEVVVLDLATGRRIARGIDAFQPIYSPDSQTIATRQPNLSVHLRDVPDPAR